MKLTEDVEVHCTAIVHVFEEGVPFRELLLVVQQFVIGVFGFWL